MTQQQIEQEARELYPLTGDRECDEIRSCCQSAYISGATKYAPVWKKIDEYDGIKEVFILLLINGIASEGYLARDGIFRAYAEPKGVPTHYMPLPELPKDE